MLGKESRKQLHIKMNMSSDPNVKNRIQLIFEKQTYLKKMFELNSAYRNVQLRNKHKLKRIMEAPVYYVVDFEYDRRDKKTVTEMSIGQVINGQCEVVKFVLDTTDKRPRNISATRVKTIHVKNFEEIRHHLIDVDFDAPVIAYGTAMDFPAFQKVMGRPIKMMDVSTFSMEKGQDTKTLLNALRDYGIEAYKTHNSANDVIWTQKYVQAIINKQNALMAELADAEDSKSATSV